MKSAQPFDGDNLAATDGVSGGEQSTVAALVRARTFRVFTNAAAFPQFEMRAANRARIRLGVEAAVPRVVVFGLALRAHRERFHRSVHAVIGQGFNDAEARAAVGAVGERVTMAAIFGIKDFAQAIRARGDVRQNERGFVAAGFAGADFKCRVAGGVEPRSFEALNETARRFFGFEPEQEFFRFRARAFHFDENALWRIVDPAGQSEFRGEAEDERTEADALHRAANGEFQAGALTGWSGFFHAGILSEAAPN